MISIVVGFGITGVMSVLERKVLSLLFLKVLVVVETDCENPRCYLLVVLAGCVVSV